MKRRDFIGHTTGLGMIVAAASLPGSLTGAAEFPDPCNVAALHTPLADRITPPAKEKIPVAFAISQGVTVIDFAGPWAA